VATGRHYWRLPVVASPAMNAGADAGWHLTSKDSRA
jgi:hypothetical protein